MMKMDLKLRFKVIEIVAFWERKLNSSHLCTSFGIGRQQASKDINDYIENHAPDNLVYDANLKGYRPSDQFQPIFTRCEVGEYLNWLSASSQVHDPFLDVSLLGEPSQKPSIETVQLPNHVVLPDILIPLIGAIRRKKRLQVAYVSLTTPKPETRVIRPHTLVYTGYRWHVRAYCEKNSDFRDFVLTRFRGDLSPLGGSTEAIKLDQYWHHRVKVKIIPDTRLEPAQRKLIAQDYGMRRNALVIETRAALVQYLLQQYRLDPHKLEAKPEAQQLMISNLAEVEKWLF